MGEQLLTPEEVAEQLRVKKQTILKWLHDGTLTGIKLVGRWRLQQSDVDEFIKNQRSGAEE